MKDIHITDLTTFTACRRQWSMSSLMRQGLQHEIVSAPLFTGQAAHVGLDGYYKGDQNINRAVTVLREWVKHRAGIISEHAGPMWERQREQVNENYRMAVGILKHYALWAPPRDEHLEILATEQRYTVPIPVPIRERGVGYSHLLRQGCYRDSRGQLVSGTIQLSGRFDGLVRDTRTGDIYLLEFKTARSLKTSPWTFRGLQGAAYMYAAQWMYGLQVKGIMYRVLRKCIPVIPPLLKTTGGYSQKKKQKTSFEYIRLKLKLQAYKEGRPVQELYGENEKLLRELYGRRNPEGNDFFMERIIHKTPSMIKSALDCIYYTGMQMADPNIPIYATPTWYNCNGCQFRDVCDLMEMGRFDVAKAVLAAEYAPRSYWEGKKNGNQTSS